MAAPIDKVNNDLHAEFGVLPERMGGGPMGLGDPNDRTLRNVEKEIVIPKMMKQRALQLCDVQVKAFCECGKKQGLLLPFMCRAENAAQMSCIVQWYQDDKFVEEVTNSFLDQRSAYRRTGIGKPKQRV